jgi:hypothetical protein
MPITQRIIDYDQAVAPDEPASAATQGPFAGMG